MIRDTATPLVTTARAFSNIFADLRPADLPGVITAELRLLDDNLPDETRLAAMPPGPAFKENGRMVVDESGARVG